MPALAAALGRDDSPATRRQNDQAAQNSIRFIRLLRGLTPDAYREAGQLALNLDWKTALEALRHQWHPFPRLQRPGLGIDNLIIDSGAFTTYTRGTTIDLRAYIEFALDARKWPGNVTIVNLDSIGGPGGHEEAAQVGFENFKPMRAAGLDPMPVVHAGESFDWLHRYLDQGVQYIGLGWSAARGNAKRDFYAAIWEHLRDSKGNPLVRVHGFAESTRDLLDYPWASADSTTWLRQHMHVGGMSPRQRAEIIYRGARRYARLQDEVNACRPSVPFRMHLVIGDYWWDFPALFAAHHRSALASFASLMSSPGRIANLKTFIAEPHALLDRQPYESSLDLLYAAAEDYDPSSR
jgi:hypothetical protein